MSAMLRYPLKQSFIEYFKLNQMDNTVYHSQLHEYLIKKIMECPNPQDKALEIWNIFVLPCDEQEGKIKEHTEYILKHNKVDYTISAIRCVGLSPFCEFK